MNAPLFTFTLTVYEFHNLLRELEFATTVHGTVNGHDREAAVFLWEKLARQANGQDDGGARDD